MKSNADVQSDLTSCPICGPGPYHPPYTICAECLPLVSPPIAEGDDRRHTHPDQNIQPTTAGTSPSEVVQAPARKHYTVSLHSS